MTLSKGEPRIFRIYKHIFAQIDPPPKKLRIWRKVRPAPTTNSYIHEIERGLVPVLELACEIVDFLKETVDLEEKRDLHDQANKARQAVTKQCDC